MYNVTVKTIVIIIGLAACAAAAAAGGRGNPGPISPYIVKTSVDAKEKLLIVTGSNFGATAPTVMLSGQVLEIKRFSDNEVVARLPRPLASATYGITVTSNGVAVGLTVDPARQAGAQGLLGGAQTLVAGLTALGAGWLYERHGRTTAYTITAACMIALIAAAFLFVGKAWNTKG